MDDLRNRQCSRSRNGMLVLLAIAGLCWLVACGERNESATTVPEPSASADSSSWPATRTTDGGGFDVTVLPEGGGIERAKHFSLGVTLVAKGGDAENLAVKVDADMPAHRHGMNTKPEVFAVGAMQYRVEGMVFHMSGDWVINVDVTQGSVTERASFAVSVD